MKNILVAVAALALLGNAHAEGVAAPKVERVVGVVTSISDSEVTLTEKGAKVEKITLGPNWSVSVSRPISVEAIEPGSYLGTTNYAKPDGTGRSIEVHLSPPGIVGPGVDFVMDAAANTTMTNGIVSTVVKIDGGKVLEVNYGSGVRRVTVPPGIPVMLNVPGRRELVKVGLMVRVTTFTPPTGGPPRQFITVGENGTPPPE